MEKIWQPVAEAAAGRRSDYALDRASIIGGQADVHRAEHKATGLVVAMKKLRGDGFQGDGLARMKREIEVGRNLGAVPSVMPLLDADVEGRWFVMPWADATLASERESVRADPAEILRVVKTVAAALDAAHDVGMIHRDIKPSNVLRLSDGARGRWVLADWGLVRRPIGLTSVPGRTRTGQPYGSIGFAAPELDHNAHRATPASDIYSLGQLIGWLFTGFDPRPNVPCLPSNGAWRAVVAEATRSTPARRPQSISDFLMLVHDEVESPFSDDWSRLEDLGEQASSGNLTAAAELIQCAMRAPDDFELHVDLLPKIPGPAWDVFIESKAEKLVSIASALAGFVVHDRGHRSYEWGASVTEMVFRLSSGAASHGEPELLEAATEAMFLWDASWDQWRVRDLIVDWLLRLEGETARIVAQNLKRFGDISHFAGEPDERKLDRRIREVLQQRSN